YLFASPHAAASSAVVDFFAAPEQVVAPEMKPIMLKKLASEVMVIQNKSYSDEEIFCRIRSLVQKPDALQSGDIATDVARIIGIAPAMTKEHLLSVESKDNILRLIVNASVLAGVLVHQLKYKLGCLWPRTSLRSCKQWAASTTNYYEY
ncbi:hypothetical protein Tco_1258906, partial [Tanacetum coccineum]